MNSEDIDRCCVNVKEWKCPIEQCVSVLTRKQTLINHLSNIHKINVDIPGKKYKLYDFHECSSTQDIPRTTLWRMKKRKKENTDCSFEEEMIPNAKEQGDDTAAMNILVHENVDVNESNNCNEELNTNEPYQDGTLFEHELDFDSDMDMDSSYQSDEEENENLFSSEEECDLSDHADICQSFKETSVTSSLNDTSAPLYILPASSQNFTSPIQYKEHILAVSAFATRHHLSDTALEDLLGLIDIHLPVVNLVEHDINKLKTNCGFYEEYLSFHTFCNVCENVISNEAEQCITPGCNGRKQKNRSQNYFVTGNLLKQLECILMRDKIWDTIKERSVVDHSTNITDITDGSEYKKLAEEDNFLHDKNNISFSLFTDGIPLFKSSGVSIWPVYLLINELPRKQRFLRKNMLLWGVWQGTGKPNMTVFLKQLVIDLCSLHKDGLTFELDGQTHCCKAILVVCTMDLPARAAVLHMTQYNGENSCIFFLDPGIVVKSGKGHCRSFPFKQVLPPLRKEDDVAKHGKLAQETRKRVYGFTGVSVLNFLPGFSLCNNTLIDYMHGILLGICKKLLSLWFSTTSYEQPYFNLAI